MSAEHRLARARELNELSVCNDDQERIAAETGAAGVARTVGEARLALDYDRAS